MAFQLAVLQAAPVLTVFNIMSSSCQPAAPPGTKQPNTDETEKRNIGEKMICCILLLPHTDLLCLCSTQRISRMTVLRGRASVKPKTSPREKDESDFQLCSRPEDLRTQDDVPVSAKGIGLNLRPDPADTTPGEPNTSSSQSLPLGFLQGATRPQAQVRALLPENTQLASPARYQAACNRGLLLKSSSATRLESSGPTQNNRLILRESHHIHRLKLQRAHFSTVSPTPDSEQRPSHLWRKPMKNQHTHLSMSDTEARTPEREEMICCILLLLTLTSCVCGTFVVNVTQSSYQAEENHNITLEWSFTTKPHTPSDFLIIFCQLFTDLRASVLYHLHEGVESPESQDEQFSGRVQCDKDVLREGRIRLHVSRLRTEDSGLYECTVLTSDGRSSGKCRLNVSEARDRPEPETEPETEPGEPNTASRRRIVLYCVVLTLSFVFLLIHFLPRKQRFLPRVQCWI
ncbi:uncharacterized protein LOC111219568 [Seriola dumerili]|uniref:uncharacterized protein LOC111219568 n=1 Tax=Seriola dumerili TaxID=41447 RepID=UPI000BBF3AB1|nr:uncharacterized protein LOC111219568 [Seriola dumerili]